MEYQDKILQRLNQLIEQAAWLKRSDTKGHSLNSDQYQDCRAWITAAQNILFQIFQNTHSPYVQHTNSIISEGETQAWEYVAGSVGGIASILKNLCVDLNAGLLHSIEERARAETFDDFLDHARAYLERKQKNEAGVIAGVVFEDTLRRIAVKYDIDEPGQKLDFLISDLAARGTITGVMAKRCRVAAGVRTKATHAQWDEFSAGDVEATIVVTDELVLAKLDG